MSSRSLSSALAAVSLFAAAACGREVPYPPAQPPPPPVAAPAPSDDAPPAAAEQEAVAQSEAAAPDAGPTIELNDDARRAFVDPSRESFFAESQRPMQECAPGKGGVLRVQIVRTKTGIAMHTDPDTSLDAPARRCALEALSVVDLTEVIAESPASTQQRIFMPQITIRW